MPFSGVCVREADSSPMDVFGLWYSEMLQATGAHMREPSAMVLATCDVQNRPSARVVLLKKYGEAGFEFVTNFNSRKGREIADNPQVALVFDWRHIGRQVRVEGLATLMDASESDAYHASRSRESKISAWCSQQSAVLESRKLLLEQFERERQRFDGQEIPRPTGGVLELSRTWWSFGRMERTGFIPESNTAAEIVAHGAVLIYTHSGLCVLHLAQATPNRGSIVEFYRFSRNLLGGLVPLAGY